MFLLLENFIFINFFRIFMFHVNLSVEFTFLGWQTMIKCNQFIVFYGESWVC